MKAIYKLKNGKIEIDLREDIINGNPFPNIIIGHRLHENGEKGAPVKLILLKDETDKLFFLVNDEKIYVSEFEAMSMQEVEQDEVLSRDEIIATLIKYRNDIAFVNSLVYHTCIGVEQEVLCIPEIKGEGKVDWKVGITLIPEDLSSITLYRSAFEIYQELIDKVRTGEIRVVCRDTRKSTRNLQKVMMNEAA